MDYSLKERFKNLSVDKVQAVGGMSVIPLISSDVYKEVKGPSGFEFKGTVSYGTMVFKSKGEGLSVIPSNTMVITTKRAQDHAMSTAGFLEDGDDIGFDTACCTQSRQGGLMESSNNEFNILPLTLRKSLGGNRFKEGYDKLWNNISRFNRGVTKNSGAHLEYFFNEFKDDLEEFTAEFEVVDGQVGALIYYGNHLVGVELAPNPDFWHEVWKWLIRGCYGAEYLRQSLLKKGSFNEIVMPNLQETKSLSDIRNVVDQYIIEGTVALANKLSGDVSFSSKKYQVGRKNKNTKMVFIDGTIGSGDILFVDNSPVYLSLYKDDIGLA